MGDLALRALRNVPRIGPGDDIARITLSAAAASDIVLQNGDLLVYAQKIISKAEGRLVKLLSVTPSPGAIELAAVSEKDPRLVELILSESKQVLRARPGVIIVEHRSGIVLANAGIDRSNIGDEDHALLLPLDPDASCQRLREVVKSETGCDIGIMIIDSVGRAWRNGTVGTLIGASGIATLLDLRGQPDLFGRKLETTELGWGDEMAAAASLVMGQAAEGYPIVHARGSSVRLADGTSRDLLRPKNKDLFR